MFKFNWLVKIIDPQNQKIFTIWDDQQQLEQFCQEHMMDIWVGCNNLHYDQYIKKAILCGIDPKRVNDQIVLQKKAGWQISSLFRKFKFIEYDVMTRIDRGLKIWEGFMGNSIKETTVPFDIDRPLTDAEKKEVEFYCQHDVEQTIEVFMHRINDFNAHMGLIKMFPEVLDIYDLSSTKAQISAKILECEKVTRDDEFDLFVLPCIKIKKYDQVIEWFMQWKDQPSKVADEIYKKKFTMMVAGIEHTFGWGGVHAGKEQYQNKGHKQGRQIWHVDVSSFYPRLMMPPHNLLTRNCKRPEKFKMIFDWRIDLKHQGKKLEQAPLKIVINGTYGICKAETSAAYDPRNANLICMNGMLMLVDLIEHLEVIKGFELIQSNTDGLIISLPDTDEAFQQMDDICYEWEQRCSMELEFDEIGDDAGHGIFQKDVNNYVFKFANGKIERKGSYVKEIGALDYDLPIVNKALVDYMMHDVPIEKTIMGCDDLKEFQMVKKIGQMYEFIIYGNKILSERVIRCFASKDSSDGGLFMKHENKTTYDKIASTPECAFLWNESVEGVKCPSKLDKRWYVNLARKRLNDFGVM